MKSLTDALRYRDVAPRSSTKALVAAIAHAPRASVTALLRSAGPFEAVNGYVFSNDGLPLREEDAAVIRARYRAAADAVGIVMVEAIRAALAAITVPVQVAGIGPVISLPQVAIDYVIQRISEPLRNAVIDQAIASIPGKFGRCGGMAFSALDLFEAGWPTARLGRPAVGDAHYAYIFERLLDSLDANLPAFLGRVATLYVLPVFSATASGLLGAAAGSVAGPPGAAIGALVGGGEDVLGLGGAKALMADNRTHVGRLAARLHDHAAWPIGLVYAGSAKPWDCHQILATGIATLPDGHVRLSVHDNNLLPSDAAVPRVEDIVVDLAGHELRVQARPDRTEYPNIRSILCEEFTPRPPPQALYRP